MKTQATLVMLLVLGVTSSLLADTVTVTRTGSGYQVGTIFTQTTEISDSAFVGGPFAFNITSYTPTSPAKSNGDYRTFAASETGTGTQDWVVGFCIDLKQYIGGTGNVFEEIDLATAPKPHSTTLDMFPMGESKAKAVSELWGRNIASALTSKGNAVAFQLAVWEIVYEDWGASSDIWDGLFDASWSSSTITLPTWNVDIGVTTPDKGVFYVDPVTEQAEVTQANLYLKTIDGNPDMRADIVAWSAPSGDATSGIQDQIVERMPGTSIEEIPAPSALVGLISMGLMGLVIAWRRRQRRS